MPSSQTMYDSTDVAAIPPSATLILVYIDGDYQTYDAARARFPNAQLVTTTTQAVGDLNAQIYDCERGDGDAGTAASWAKAKLQLGQRPTIYCSRIGQAGFGWPWVQAAIKALGINPSQIDYGIADYTNWIHLVPGSAFTQYANPPGSGGNYDISLTNGVWPYTEAPPPVLNKPACSIQGTPSGKGYYIFAEDGGVFAYGDAQFYGSLPQIHITPAQPIVDVALYESAGVVKGYWLLGADGGIFALPPGITPFYGAANH